MAKKKSDSAKTTADADGAAQQPYVVLARKYRPQTFDDLIGQEAMVRTLRNAFASGRIAQAYMLTGVRGVGKTTTARIHRPRAQLRDRHGQGADLRHARARPTLHRDHGEPPSRRASRWTPPPTPASTTSAS